MARAGIEPAFTLGRPFPGAGPDEVCEPHVSLFMLEVAEADLPDVLAAVGEVAATHAPFAAAGSRIGHNPQGAPELFFEVTAQWRTLQRAVIDRVEPLRRGRLRPVDPAGRSVAALVGAGAAADVDVDVDADADADADQVDQLTRYGYDEVHDERADRFRPHVTLAWPAARSGVVDTSGLAVDALDHEVCQIAVAGMHPYGTCTTILSRSGLAE